MKAAPLFIFVVLALACLIYYWLWVLPKPERKAANTLVKRILIAIIIASVVLVTAVMVVFSLGPITIF